MKKIVVFGASGNIGRQSIKILKQEKNNFLLTAISIGKNDSFLKEDLKEFNSIKKVYSTNKLDFSKNSSITFVNDNLISLIEEDTDYVINALSGFYGLQVTIAAIKKGKILLNANKESFVCAGKLINSLLKENQTSSIYPLDSEHCAIFQCIEDNKINKILLTASGGPFIKLTLEETKNVSKELALKHPKWNMGPKITIDSATMFNKAFEILEAYHLFGTNNIEVLIHRDSIIHSMVEFEDMSIKAQLSIPNMETVIAYFLNYPIRKNYEFERIDFSNIINLSLQKIDTNRFLPIKMAYEAIEFNSLAIAMNAASEICVQKFLENKISFYDITKISHKIFLDTIKTNLSTFEEIRDFDNIIRAKTLKIISKE